MINMSYGLVDMISTVFAIGSVIVLVCMVHREDNKNNADKPGHKAVIAWWFVVVPLMLALAFFFARYVHYVD